MYPIHETKSQILPFVAAAVWYLVMLPSGPLDVFPFSTNIMALDIEWKLSQTGKHNVKQCETMLEEPKIQDMETPNQRIWMSSFSVAIKWQRRQLWQSSFGLIYCNIY